MNVKIKLASLREPLNQGLDVVSAFTFIAMILFAEITCLVVWIMWLYYGNAFFKTLWFVYLIHMLYDYRAANNCSRGQGSQLVRGLSVWKYFTQYFPVNLIKTAELPPDRNYLFAAYPHGVLCMGIFCNFATNNTGFSKEFPGIRSKICTLSYHFFWPLFREVTLGWGMTSASAESLQSGLTQSNDKHDPSNSDGYSSNAMVILIGGAKEAFYSRPGNYQIILKSRKGFVKMALKTGASLVPVFSFGEVEVYKQPNNDPQTLLRRFQEFIKGVTGIAPVCFIGRGFFQETFGIIPLRRPINTVVGAPISVEKENNPSKESIDKLHEKFTATLINLFESHKHKYVKNAENTHLIIE